MFKRVEPARCHVFSDGYLIRRRQPKPDAVRRTEARNYGYRLLPGTIVSPDHARSPRPEDPLVGSGNEKITAQLADVLILYSETMDTIDTKQNLIFFGSPGIDLANRIGHGPQRQLHTRRRVYPCHRNDARVVGYALLQITDNRVLGYRGRVFIK